MDSRPPKSTVFTLLGTGVFFALVALMLGSSTGRSATGADSADVAVAEPNGTRALVCSMSSFFSFDRNEVIGDTVRIGGRGLLDCKNGEGFTLEEPVVVDLVVKIRGDIPKGEVALSGNTAAFVIPRDPGQLQDLYHSRDFGWTTKTDDKYRKIVFRGVANDLVIEMNLTSLNSPLFDLDIESLRIRYDDEAPDLGGY